MNNREIAEKIVQEICTVLLQIPSKKDWKKLVDFTERQMEQATRELMQDANELVEFVRSVADDETLASIKTAHIRAVIKDLEIKLGDK